MHCASSRTLTWVSDAGSGAAKSSDFMYVSAHVFPSRVDLVSKCSLAQCSLGEPIAPTDATLFWQPFCLGWVANI